MEIDEILLNITEILDITKLFACAEEEIERKTILIVGTRRNETDDVISKHVLYE